MIIAIWHEQGEDPTPVAEVELHGDCDVSYWAASGYRIGEKGGLPGSSGL